MSVRSTPLFRYVLRRILEAIPLVFAVIIVNFIIIHITPGDPAIALAGEFGATPQYIAALRHEMGLDLPLYEQLLIYLSHIIRGDLGYSLVYRQSVLSIISARIPLTILLVGTALIFASVVGIAVGVFSGKRPYSVLDALTMSFSMLGYSIPVFWLGQMMILGLALGLGLFPTGGWITLKSGPPDPIHDTLDIAWHLMLPAVALGVQYLVLIARITRSGLLEQMGEDYVITAQAKGLDNNTVVYKHALRNAILPVITVIGVQFGFMIGGAVVTETVFSWPGIGRLTFDAVFARDYPVLLGILLLISICTVVANLVTDILYAVLDPRVRYR